MSDLTVEFNEKYAEVAKKAGASILAGGKILVTPAVGQEDYWVYRVKLSDEQAIIAFPKFFTLGIGFAKEEDWNTNLPYSCETDKIYNHIKHNKGNKAIKAANVRRAIKLIQETIERDLTQGDIERLNGA